LSTAFECGRGPRAGQRLRLRMQRPALQAGCPVVLAPMASSPTHCANCVRSVRTVATKSEHEACFARWPWELCSSALHRRRSRWPTRGLGDAGASHSKTSEHRRGSAAAGGLVKALSMPTEDGGEANPGSRGGAGGHRLTAGERARTQTVRGTVCARRAPGAMPQAWTDSLPRRPRPARHHTTDCCVPQAQVASIRSAAVSCRSLSAKGCGDVAPATAPRRGRQTSSRRSAARAPPPAQPRRCPGSR
jgi:hypothetical protein